MGVDIGHSSVKVVGISVGKKPTFIGCKEITMDPKYLQKEGFDNTALIGQALREAMRSAAPKPITANIAYSAVSESLVFRKVLDLPVLPTEDELVDAMHMEVIQYLPNPIEDMELDYQKLGVSTEGNTQQIMVVAVNRKIIQDYLAVFDAAKMTVRAIGDKPAALARAVISPKEEDAIVMVDIGSEICTVSLYEEGIIRVTGSLNIGGNIIRNSQSHEVDEEKLAEHIKRLANGVIDEVEDVVKFFTNRTVHQKKVKEIRVTGGGSMIAGVPEAIAKATDFKVVTGESIIALPPFCDRRFLGALGCALYPMHNTEA